MYKGNMEVSNPKREYKITGMFFLLYLFIKVSNPKREYKMKNPLKVKVVKIEFQTLKGNIKSRAELFEKIAVNVCFKP